MPNGHDSGSVTLVGDSLTLASRLDPPFAFTSQVRIDGTRMTFHWVEKNALYNQLSPTPQDYRLTRFWLRQ
jgi:hypothetical protein